MLAVKENIGISRDFAERMFRGFHGKRTSRRCAAASTETPNTKFQTPGKPQYSMPKKCGGRCFRVWRFGISLGFGTWNLGSKFCAALSRRIARFLCPV
jgi:hypothetical protein